MKKMWYIHVIEYYSAFKKEGNPATYDTMDEFKNIMLSSLPS